MIILLYSDWSISECRLHRYVKLLEIVEKSFLSRKVMPTRNHQAPTSTSSQHTFVHVYMSGTCDLETCLIIFCPHSHYSNTMSHRASGHISQINTPVVLCHYFSTTLLALQCLSFFPVLPLKTLKSASVLLIRNYRRRDLNPLGQYGEEESPCFLYCPLLWDWQNVFT